MTEAAPTEPMCPGCNEVPASQVQERNPERCRWCGYDHATGAVVTFKPASSAAMDALDDYFDQLRNDDGRTG